MLGLTLLCTRRHADLLNVEALLSAYKAQAEVDQREIDTLRTAVVLARDQGIEECAVYLDLLRADREKDKGKDTSLHKIVSASLGVMAKEMRLMKTNKEKGESNA